MYKHNSVCVCHSAPLSCETWPCLSTAPQFWDIKINKIYKKKWRMNKHAKTNNKHLKKTRFRLSNIYQVSCSIFSFCRRISSFHVFIYLIIFNSLAVRTVLLQWGISPLCFSSKLCTMIETFICFVLLDIFDYLVEEMLFLQMPFSLPKTFVIFTCRNSSFFG